VAGVALATVLATTPSQHGVRCAHQQDGHRGLATSKGRRVGRAGLGAGGPRSQARRVPGDRRRTRVPDKTLAWAGGQRGGTSPPHPAQVAALRGRSNGLSLPGCVPPGTGGERVLLPLTARRGSGAPWRWPAPGSRTRLPVAAAFFFLLKKRNVILAGPRQGQASLRSVRTRTLDMA